MATSTMAAELIMDSLFFFNVMELQLNRCFGESLQRGIVPQYKSSEQWALDRKGVRIVYVPSRVQENQVNTQGEYGAKLTAYRLVSANRATVGNVYELGPDHDTIGNEQDLTPALRR